MSATDGMTYQTVNLTLKLKHLPKSNCILFKMGAVCLSEMSAGPTRIQNPEDYHLNIIRSKGLKEYTIKINFLDFLNRLIIYFLKYYATKYRVIHKSLRDFRTRQRNNQDRHGRKEHINR